MPCSTAMEDIGGISNYISLPGGSIFYSCNMGTRDLPDMYAQSPRAAGIHIRKITSAHVTANM